MTATAHITATGHPRGSKSAIVLVVATTETGAQKPTPMATVTNPVFRTVLRTVAIANAITAPVGP